MRLGDVAAAATDVPADDALLAQVLANHFDGARVEGRTAHLEMGGLRVECAVDALHVGPVLRAGLTGSPVEDHDVEDLRLTIDGRRFLVVLSAIDRAPSAGAVDVPHLLADRRDRLGGRPWLTPW